MQAWPVSVLDPRMARVNTAMLCDKWTICSAKLICGGVSLKSYDDSGIWAATLSEKSRETFRCFNTIAFTSPWAKTGIVAAASIKTRLAKRRCVKGISRVSHRKAIADQRSDGFTGPEAPRRSKSTSRTKYPTFLARCQCRQ